MGIQEIWETYGNWLFRPYVWSFVAALVLQIVFLVLIIRKPKWWKWLLLSLTEASAVVATVVLAETRPGWSSLVIIPSALIFMILLIITLILWATSPRHSVK